MSNTINESIHSWHKMKIESSLLVHSVPTHTRDSVNAFQCFRDRSKVDGPKGRKRMVFQKWSVLSQTVRPFGAKWTVKMVFRANMGQIRLIGWLMGWLMGHSTKSWRFTFKLKALIFGHSPRKSPSNMAQDRPLLHNCSLGPFTFNPLDTSTHLDRRLLTWL